ncbi:hypothetical protein ERJ75_001472000 [Trypanosoma vivax]|nr:hypothetical protein ERJ75_001472000 [Trypanosoma vivax]
MRATRRRERPRTGENHIGKRPGNATAAEKKGSGASKTAASSQVRLLSEKRKDESLAAFDRNEDKTSADTLTPKLHWCAERCVIVVWDLAILWTEKRGTPEKTSFNTKEPEGSQQQWEQARHT